MAAQRGVGREGGAEVSDRIPPLSKPRLFVGRWGVVVLSEVVATTAIGKGVCGEEPYVKVNLRNGSVVNVSRHDGPALDGALVEFYR
jgi:hypothetical protein